MTFPKLTSIGPECGSSNGLVDLMKQFNQDRSLQQDRYGSTSKASNQSGFRSQTLSSPALSSDNLANDFFQLENHEKSHSSSPFQYASPSLSFMENPPLSDDNTWIQEFQLKNRISTPPLYEEFEQHCSRQSSQSPTLIQATWANEFQQINSDGEEQLAFQRAFEEVADEDLQDCNWDQEFADHEAWEAQFRPNILIRSSSQHMLDAKDWSVEFSKYDDLTALSRSLGEDDWIKKYQNDKEEWQRLEPGYGYRAIHPEYQTYNYMLDNPYLSHSEAIDGAPHTTLADEIMALEAKSQLFPEDAKTWERLGLKQQENERDGAAITALEKAVSLDAQCLDAWLALAVSYTNEHCRMDAYNCLEQWIANNSLYKHITENKKLGQYHTEEKKRHDYITQLFLEAARTSPEEMDPDVQVGLGVLFNMSEEYDKAVDCFKAALMSKPQDYQLWNKVGATLANSRDSMGAIEMYDRALQINPSFVRARYNLAISCMNMGQYLEAAEHFLTTLNLQRAAAMSAGEAARALGENTSVNIPNYTSDGIWDSLRLLMYMMNREDLAPECDRHNLDAFIGQFDF